MTRGAVAAVLQPGKRDSAGSQFFVVVTDQPALEGQYTIFGRVVEGMEVVQKISEAPTDANGRVTDRIEMTRVTIRDTPPPEPEPFTTESVEELATLSRGARDLAGADHARVPAGQGARPRAQFPAARLARRVRRHGLPPRRPRVRPPGRHAEHAHQPGARNARSSTCARSSPEFNDTPHVKGTLSMARTDDPNSASTSFFICTGPRAFARRQVHGVRASRRRNGGRGGNRGRPGRWRDASAAHRGDEGHRQDGMMAGLKSALQIGPSGPRVGRRVPASRRPRAAAQDGEKKKRPSLDVVWREARELVWAHRGRLGLGFLLMVINRLAGLVLPASSKWLIDEVIEQVARRPARADCACRRCGNGRAGGDRVCAVAGARRRGPAVDHRHAPGGAAPRRAAAGALLRFDEDRRPHLAHHERRRRHPEPGRQRHRAAARQHADRGHRARRALLAQLAADRRSPWCCSASSAA